MTPIHEGILEYLDDNNIKSLVALTPRQLNDLHRLHDSDTASRDLDINVMEQSLLGFTSWLKRSCGLSSVGWGAEERHQLVNDALNQAFQHFDDVDTSDVAPSIAPSVSSVGSVKYPALKEVSVGEREKKIHNREEGVEDREQDVLNREHNVIRVENRLTERERNVADREEDLSARERDVTNRVGELENELKRCRKDRGDLIIAEIKAKADRRRAESKEDHLEVRRQALSKLESELNQRQLAIDKQEREFRKQRTERLHSVGPTTTPSPSKLVMELRDGNRKLGMQLREFRRLAENSDEDLRSMVELYDEKIPQTPKQVLDHEAEIWKTGDRAGRDAFRDSMVRAAKTVPISEVERSLKACIRNVEDARAGRKPAGLGAALGEIETVVRLLKLGLFRGIRRDSGVDLSQYVPTP